MAAIRTQSGAERSEGDDLDLESPILVEGFPGLGLVGKIATDHLVDQLEMRYYASVHCEGMPRVGVYRDGDRTARPPVRLYVSEEHDLLALQSDVPVDADAREHVATCLTDWVVEHEATPVYLSGRPVDREENGPSLYGVATGDGAAVLEAHDVPAPPEDGVVTGPTGALIEQAARRECDSLGLVIGCDPQFPDPEAASVLLREAIAPIAGLEVEVGALVDHAEEIRDQKERLAQQMQVIDEEESTQARPLRMYQ